MRALVAAAVIGLLPACVLVRQGGQEFGPEQFEFTVVSLDQAGGQADAAVRDLTSGPEDRLVPGSAVIVATVQTPEGQVRFVDYQTTSARGVSNCEAVVASRSASGGCGPAGAPQPDPQPLNLSGVAGSSEGWSSASFRTSPEVFEVVATAQDGTTYRISPGGGVGFVMWKNVHGALTLTAFDAEGNSLGQETLGMAGG